MATTIAIITFTGIPLVNDLLTLVAHNIVTNTDENVTNIFKTLRLNTGEVTIGSTINETATNFANAIVFDYSSDVDTADFDVVVVDNIVTITCRITGVFDYFTDYVIEGDFATVEIETPVPYLTVTGLESDRYLINNEINLNVTANVSIVYLKLKLTNLSNNTTSTDLIFYPNQFGSALLSIQSIVKSLFDYPEDAEGYIVNDQPTKNANKYKIQIFYTVGLVETLGYEVLKTFVRGGRRTTETNQNLSIGILTPTNKIPYWIGYETAEYYIDDVGFLRKRLIMDIAAERIKEMRSKGCNEKYVKFINQNGGYSNWLFESHSTNENNINLGGFIRDNKVDDLGNTADYKVSAQSKVPKEFKQLILDLIVSPEIYIDGVRMRSGRNSITYDNIKRVYNVSINFEVDNRFNPSLLWSN